MLTAEAAPYSHTRETCLHEVFEAQVARTPSAVAVACGGRTLTYAELDRHANLLARWLRDRGAGPGSFVALYFERSQAPIVAILACLKAGAAYVPIDPSYPGERIAHIVEELGVLVCLTDSTLGAAAAQHFTTIPVVDIESRWHEMLPGSYAPIRRDESGVRGSDLAYVIYTSGTTGKPKGVMAEHRHVTQYVEAFNEACATGPYDRVHQGFSLSFDGSVEEIWMAFSNGSTLVVPTRDVPKFGADLGRYLAENNITYLSTVPTLLTTLPDDVPCLRTIVLSGEVCPPELVNRWARPGLRLLNVYGPTEATVNTTVAECRPGRPVTIGRPLRGYDLHVVDDNLRPVPHGATGELLVSGPTLARGYAARPDLTAERFLNVPGLGRCYRTGDLVNWSDEGELLFHGRMDTQVKIRGYRIELSEIESVLQDHPWVRASAVRVVERNGLPQLAAYICIDPPRGRQHHDLDRDDVLELLKSRVPAYMIPSHLDVIEELPRTASGKLDRGRLPRPRVPLVRSGGQGAAPSTPLEREIAQVWVEQFGVDAVSIDDDFFTDLGGHSLVAAQMVTKLRSRLDRPVTLRDAYEHPTVRALATYLSSTVSVAPAGAAPADPRPARVGPLGRVLGASLQAISLPVLGLIPALPVVVMFLAVRGWVLGTVSVATLATYWIVVMLGTWPVMLTISIAAKWILVGRYKPGRHRLWGFYYCKWWLCGQLKSLSGAGFLAGTPALPLYFRLMGAKVGKRCTLDTVQVGAWDLISIGDDTSIGADTQLLGHRVEDGWLKLGRVDIGSGCFVGIHSAFGLDVTMGDGATMDDQSMLPDGGRLEPNRSYQGSPCRPAPVELHEPAQPASTARRFAFGLAHFVGADLLGLIGVLPAVGVLVTLWLAYVAGGLVWLFAAAAAWVPLGTVTSCLYLAGLRRLILPRLKPGTYRVESMTYLRKWLSDGIMAASRALLLPVYTTLYLPSWLRLMGAKIGPRAELSTVWSLAPELVDIGPESFFADGSIVGGRRTYGGRCQVSANRVGARSFVGNGAILPVGHSLGDGCLLGVQSVTPAAAREPLHQAEFLGSPAFRLAHRPKNGDFDLSQTYQPTAKLYAQRAVVDALRILIPGYLGLAALVGWVFVMIIVAPYGGLAVLAASPLTGLAIGSILAVVVAILKKVVMGTFKPEIKPLWSLYVWLNEMVNGAYESVTAPFLASLMGTPFAAPFLRLMGCRIGKRVFLGTTLFSEWDLVEVGDDVALNHGVVIQNHLFEDRVFKSSHLKIGAGASVGNMTVILYDSVIEPGSVVGTLSLLMKGETLAAGTRWQGIPTAPAP